MTFGYGSSTRLAQNEARGIGVETATGHLEETKFLKKRERKSGEALNFNGLITNYILTALPGEDFARLLPYLEPVSLVFGEDLYKAEGGARFVYFPESAVVSHLYVLEDGSTTEAVLIGKDGLIGLSAIFNSESPSYWTHVTIAGNALRIKADFFVQEFSRGGALQRLILAYTGARIAQVSQRAVCNGRHTVGERLCTWLLMIGDRMGDDHLPLTHEQIASHLGVRRSGVTSVANQLRDQGIISYSRGRINILNRLALELAACECYEVLNQHLARKQACK